MNKDMKIKVGEVTESRDIRQQLECLMDTKIQMQEAQEIDRRAKEHMVELLVKDNNYRCFTLNLRAISRFYR